MKNNNAFVEYPEIRLTADREHKFNLLERGFDLAPQDVSDVREEVQELIEFVHDRLFVSASPEHSAWVKRSQQYTGHIVDALERHHFANLATEK